MIKLNTENFTEKAKVIHNSRYNYNLVDYVNNHTKVDILCQVHGVFKQTPNSHLSGKGCPLCANIVRNENSTKSTQQFIDKAIIVHSSNYDYSKVVYNNAKTKVNIICKVHGDFYQLPNNHLQGKGCRKCAREANANKIKVPLAKFIEQAKQTHGELYDYSKVVYTKAINKVIIICPVHGEFLQTPSNHKKGHGCSACGFKASMEKSNNSYRFDNYKDTPTQFYVIKYKGLYKVGITTKTVDKRYAQEVSDTDEIETLFIKYFDNYKDAYTHEQCMLLLNTNYKYTGEPIFNNTGTSELFTSIHKGAFN